MSIRSTRFALVLLLGLIACVDDPSSPGTIDSVAPRFSVGEHGARGLVVMTRNLYLGADIDGILAIQNPNQVPIAIAQAWATIVSTNFPARAEALADEIAEARPHLIGLQEAVLYRRQSPSDYVLGNTSLNASTVVYDFLPILLSALQARGLRYRVVARLTTTDLELPMYTGQGPLPFDDIRWTDGDAILAREDVVVRNSFARVYQAFTSVAVAGAPIRLLHGWTSVDAVAAKTELRFVNTHLETQPFRPVQEAQTRELLQWLARHHGTRIVVGDFNSSANPSAPAESKTASYGMIRAAGFEDLWLRHERANEGLTCCFAETLTNPSMTFDQRLDLIFLGERKTRGEARLEVVGEELADRTPSGLWPSDHAGVVAKLHLPASGK